MTRGGRNKDRTEPERRCIVSGESQPKGGLVRFAVDPQGTLVPDIAAKLPGRGYWVSANRATLDTAVKRKQFSKAARTAVAVPADLSDLVEKLLADRVVELISIARKAGQAIAGYGKVKTWLDRGEAAVLIQASDGSARGKSKLSTPPDGRFIGILTASELGLAFGREHVIHCALAGGRLGQRVVEDATRLAGVRASIGENVAGKGTKTT